jgi:hypothetical protein
MTLDKLLETYLQSSAGEWHHVSAPLVPGSEAHETLYVYKDDVALVVAEGRSVGDYEMNWVRTFPDPSAYMVYIDLFYNLVPVYREGAVVVDGGRAVLPFPAGYLESGEPSRGWKVERRAYDFVRHFSVIRSVEAHFDAKFGQAERAEGESRVTVV